MALNDVDYSDVNSPCYGLNKKSSVSQSNKRARANTEVLRCTKFSFECPPSTLMYEDILDDFSEEDTFFTGRFTRLPFEGVWVGSRLQIKSLS